MTEIRAPQSGEPWGHQRYLASFLEKCLLSELENTLSSDLSGQRFSHCSKQQPHLVAFRIQVFSLFLPPELLSLMWRI
jgi:hypothetical protein